MNGNRLAKEIATRLRALTQHWPGVHFERVEQATVGDRHQFTGQVNLSGLRREDVRVELFADAVGTHEMLVVEASCDGGPKDHANVYRADVSASRPAVDFTMRVVAAHDAALTPPERAAYVRWQR